VFLTAFVPFVWAWPLNWVDLGLMIASGAFGAFGHLLLVRAYVAASASTLAPFTYAHGAFSIVTGFLFFGAFPDAWSLVGMAMILTTGVVMALRRRAGK